MRAPTIDRGLDVEVPLFRVMRGLRVDYRATEERQLEREEASASAKSLALGHRLMRMLDEGEVEGVNELSRSLGVSSARVSMLISLTWLAPDLQEAVLVGRADASGLGFHSLLKVSRLRSWGEQRDWWGRMRWGGDRTGIQASD